MLPEKYKPAIGFIEGSFTMRMFTVLPAGFPDQSAAVKRGRCILYAYNTE
jgi:hypothetical protein